MGSSILSLHTQHVTILSMAAETDKENRRGEDDKERKERKRFFFPKKANKGTSFFFSSLFFLLFLLFLFFFSFFFFFSSFFFCGLFSFNQAGAAPIGTVGLRKRIEEDRRVREKKKDDE